MNRVYAEKLFNYIPDGQRKIILRSMKENINGFRRLDLAPSNILKGLLKNDEKFCDNFLRGVTENYGCSIKKYSHEEQLPKLGNDNCLGVFAWKCYQLDGSPEACYSLEEICRQCKQILSDNMVSTIEDLSQKPEELRMPVYISEDVDEIKTEQLIEGLQNQKEIIADNDGGEFMSEEGQYIGYVQETNGYYNFWPVHIVRNGMAEPVSFEERQKRFPDLGNINFSSKTWDYIRKNYLNTEILVITLAKTDLIENRRQDGYFQKTNYKVDINQLEGRRRIKRLKDLQIYPVLHPANTIDFSKNVILIREKNINLKDEYLVEENNIFYGPYHVNINEDGMAQVNLANNYLVNSYRIKEGKVEYIEINIENSDYPSITWYCVLLDNRFSCELIDKISDRDLLKLFTRTFASRKDSEKVQIKSDLIDDYASSAFHGLPDEIIEGRVQRIKSFLEEQTKQEQVQEDVAYFIADLFYKFGESDYFSDLMKKILDNSDLTKKIQSFAIAEQRLSEMQNKYEEIQIQCDRERKRIEAEVADREKRIFELAEERSEEVRSLKAQKKELEKDIEELQIEKSGRKEILDLGIEREVLERQIEELRDKQRQQMEKGKKADQELQQKLAETAKNVVNTAFDGKIADQVFQAAAEWNQEKQENVFKEIATELVIADEGERLTGNALVEYLVDSIKRYRPDYSANEILNIFICVTQNFLTVFSGEPGTGKTSICNIIAHVLGTSKVSGLISKPERVEVSRYVPISIERGWTSKRDFIGYYNPLSQTFEKANKHLYDGLRLLAEEGELSQYPYIVLLDEANLSPIEYYWADFMNICDMDSPFNKITLGDNIQLYIPQTLRFVATINNDDTTEKLSPRLIDRAALIQLPEARYVQIKDENLKDISFVRVVEWKALQEVFSVESFGEMDLMSDEIYEEICRLFMEDMRISISPRVDRAVRKYWTTAKELFESEEGKDKTIIALDYAIAQKLLPKINGSGDFYLKFLERLQGICEKNSLSKCEKIVRGIIKRGKASMNYYQYF